jgi:hypothetical protein
LRDAHWINAGVGWSHRGHEVVGRGQAIVPRTRTAQPRPPLTGLVVVVALIAATTTQTGRTVHAEPDQGIYPLGVKVSGQQPALSSVHGVR